MVNDHASWDPVFGLPDYSYEYRVIKRAHLVVHVLRCVNGLNECLHVKVPISSENSPCQKRLHCAVYACARMPNAQRPKPNAGRP